jgi:hypothetical protein
MMNEEQTRSSAELPNRSRSLYDPAVNLLFAFRSTAQSHCAGRFCRSRIRGGAFAHSVAVIDKAEQRIDP